MVHLLAWIWNTVLLMTRPLTFLLLFLVSLSTEAQEISIRADNIILPDNISLDVRASSDKQYLHEEWLPGTFYYPNGSTREYEQIKFDRFASKLRIIVEGAELDVFPSLLSGLVIRDSENRVHVFVIKDYDGAPAYYEVMSTGGYLLLSHVFRKLETDGSGNTVGTTTTLRFELEQEVINMKEEWFVLVGEKLSPLKPNTKAVAKLTGQDRKQLDKFVVENNLDLSLRHHMAALFDHLNTP